jgi:hypothetical protein
MKAVLLANRNKFPAVLLVHAVHMTETLREPSGFGAKIIGCEHRWHIGAGLKLIALQLCRKTGKLNSAVLM